MQTPIQITTDAQGASVVSARELYELLGFDMSQWARWRKSNIQQNPFALEGTDWQRLDIMSNGNPTIDYALTIDFAERLCMLARTEKGEEVRRWFQSLKNRALPTDPTLLQLIQTQNTLLTKQQDLLERIQTNQQSQIDKLRADMALFRTGKRPTRRRHDQQLPGIRLLWPETDPERNAILRKQINQVVNSYCERIIGATQSDTYQYLYSRLQSKFGLNLYHISRQTNENLLDIVERHGYLQQLYKLAMAELLRAK